MISEKIRYIPTDLSVVVSSDSGYLKVTDPVTKKPLSKIYVKTFSQGLDGSVSFYKDGYTDMRGVFDYASLNENKLDSISRFAVLVLSSKLGAIDKVVPKPTKQGIYERVTTSIGQQDQKADVY